MVLLSIEARMVLDWTLFLIFLSTLLFRFWTIRSLKYSRLSARGLASICLVGTLISCLPNFVNNTWIGVQKLKYRHSGHRDLEIPFGVPPQIFVKILKMVYTGMYQYFCALWLVKASFLVVYFEIMAHLPAKVRLILYGSTVFTFATFVTLVMTTMLWCRPINRSWALNQQLFCAPLHDRSYVYMSTSLNVSSDLLIMAIGCYILSGVKLRCRGIYAASFVIFLGCMTVFIAIFRMAILIHAINEQAKTFDLTDYAIISSEVEGTLAGCAACLPALRVYVRRTTEPTNQNTNSNELPYIPGKSSNRQRTLGIHDDGSTAAINLHDNESLGV